MKLVVSIIITFHHAAWLHNNILPQIVLTHGLTINRIVGLTEWTRLGVKLVFNPVSPDYIIPVLDTAAIEAPVTWRDIRIHTKQTC